MRGRSLFPPFAGVALADILANSVAIVIIMIVVTLMTRYEEEQDKLEQTEDVAVLLSRELATSFVMNALPTSPPAQLHDYVVSPLDRNPQHATMPIIELHDEFLRDYYTGRVYRRDELLRHDNALDAYLAQLAPEQLAAMRVDVYGIRQFYVAMSIFKAHHHQPRHWHFLGAARGSTTGASGPHQLLAARPPRVKRDEGADGPGGALGGGAPLDGSRGGLPADVSLARAGRGGSGAYPNDALAGVGGGQLAQEYFNLPGRAGDDAAQGRDGSAQARPGQPTGAGDGGASSRFRSAVPASESVALDKLQALDMLTVLRGLFAYMAAEQAAADRGLPSGLPRYDFRRDVLERAAGLPEPTAQQAQLLRSLKFLMETPRQPESAALALRPLASPDLHGQALGLFFNDPLLGARWLRDEHQTSTVPDAAEVTLQLGAHATIHEGLRVSVGPDDVILMPPPAVADAAPRWRVVTLVSAQRDDFVTGFVFAAADASGLILPTEENAVNIRGVRVATHFPALAFRDDFRQLLFYGALAAAFAGAVVCRRWRLRRLAAA